MPGMACSFWGAVAPAHYPCRRLAYRYSLSSLPKIGREARLLNAASRFAFNRYAECLTYLWRNKKEAGQKNLHEEYGLLVSSAPVKFLFSMKKTPLLSLRERLFLRLTKDRHVALAFRLSAADLKARQMGGYVIHMRFIK